MPIRRLTQPTRRVLRALMTRPADEWYGLELCKEAGLPTGSLYPLMARLEHDGWVISRWEDPDQQEIPHRPRRRYYRLTPDGAEGIKALVGTAPAPRAGLDTTGAFA